MLNQEVQVCGPDGCAIDTAPVRKATPTNVKTLNLDVFSDTICPWCYIGKRRLEKAAELLGPEYKIHLHWRAFELNPTMPKEGADRAAFRKAKFGSAERAQQLEDQVVQAARQEGIDFQPGLHTRVPNTFDSHRLIWFAEQKKVQDAVVERLFKAYFTEGGDVANHENLADWAAEAGMDRAEVLAFLQTDQGKSEVLAEKAQASRLRISGVPSVVLQGEPLFSGAQPPEIVAQLFLELLAG